MRSALAGTGLVVAFALVDSAAVADWPLPPDAAPEEYADPSNWPDDPSYGPGEDGFGGQWNLWSFIPPEALPIVRPAEISMGAGAHIDRAWSRTIGDPSVVIAVLDSGIEWDSGDLIDKYWINAAELPSPPAPEGYAGDPDDIDGNGVFDVRDFALYDLPDANGNGLRDPGDLIAEFSDGIDDDDNGYVDDISGWDFFKDDNDPYDDTRFGHGTGEARDSMAAANDGRGSAGVCPLCRALMVRVADSFVAEGTDFAQGVVFAVDSGASIVQEALGAVDNPTFAREALDYAWSRDVTVIASAADENSRHQNVPGTNNHTVYVHAIVFDERQPQMSTTFLNFNNCTNYGGNLVLSVPGEGCSSEATGIESGVAGLVYSMARQAGLDPPLSAGEAVQLLTRTADDIDVPESRPDDPSYDDSKYPSRPGWDQRFGYGRPNARSALDWIAGGRIPPEVDLTEPMWFEVLYPDQTPAVTLRGHIDARRAPSFDFWVEWARGIEPANDEFTTIASGENRSSALDGQIATFDVSDLDVDNAGEMENRFTITVRVRAVAHYGADVGDVTGEMRKVFYVHRDPDLVGGFPRFIGPSGESSPKLVDLDGEPGREILLATADGEVHALRPDGSEAPGWPARVSPAIGMDPSGTPSYVLSAAYATGEVSDDVRSPILATPAVGDLDGDGGLEVVVVTYDGFLHVFHADGTGAAGFPQALPAVPSADTSPTRLLDQGVFSSPVLEDLDGDDRLEIVFGAFDGNLYAFRADGSLQPGFPVAIHYPSWEGDTESFARVMTSPAVAELNGDGIPDIVVGSNEVIRGMAGAAYVVHGDGNLHEGGPYHENWPVNFFSMDLLPLVGEGSVSPAAIADTDGDGVREIAMVGTGSSVFPLMPAAQPPQEPGRDPRWRLMNSAIYGRLSNSVDAPIFNAFSAGSFGDLDQDRVLDFVHGGSGFNLALNLSGGGKASPFDHLVGAWSTDDGTSLPGFPQKIADYQFFMNPAVADVSGDVYPEVLVGTGGFYLHAFDALGRQPDGWPKFTGQWIVASPAVGDLDADGTLEVVEVTRSGWLYAWHTPASATEGVVAWESFRHDLRNTGSYDTPLEQGVLSADVPPLVDEPPVGDPDAGADAAMDVDGGSDEPASHASSGGCSCRAGDDPGSRAGSSAWLVALLVLVRRRGRSACSSGPPA
ncbi:MAG: VCBS repeat-containing protein [Deltaproteobacteria bacterium]|nr:VCBS repeat-containing protein [Deltaproteobacteria bacterium]